MFMLSLSLVCAARFLKQYFFFNLPLFERKTCCMVCDKFSSTNISVKPHFLRERHLLLKALTFVLSVNVLNEVSTTVLFA
jgi:hypothetical protein